MRKIIYRIAWSIAWVVAKVIFPFKAEGKENIPAEGGFVMCINHISLIDPVIVLLTCPRHVRFVAKAELFKNKLFGELMKTCGAFPINRGQNDTDAISVAESIVKGGEPLGIFVEGTRTKSPTGEPGRPKSGAALIASETGAMVMPVAVVYKCGRPRPFRRCTVRYGQPFELRADEQEGQRGRLRKITGEIFDRIVALWRQGI